MSFGTSVGRLSFPWWLSDQGGFFQPRPLHKGVTVRGWGGGKTGESHLALTRPYSVVTRSTSLVRRSHVTSSSCSGLRRVLLCALKGREGQAVLITPVQCLPNDLGCSGAHRAPFRWKGGKVRDAEKELEDVALWIQRWNDKWAIHFHVWNLLMIPWGTENEEKIKCFWERFISYLENVTQIRIYYSRFCLWPE